MTPDRPEPSAHDRYYDLAAVLALITATVIMLLTSSDYGNTWDEPAHLVYGDHVYAFYSSGFEDLSALSYRIDYLYGGGFDLLGAIFRKWVMPPLDRYDAIHLFGALVTSLGLWGTWRLGRNLGGARAGLLAALFIIGTAVYWGHATNNPKDPPFAVGYVWSMAFLVEAIRQFPRVERGVMIKLAVAIGLAMSVRIAGLLLLCYLAGAIVVFVGYHAALRRSAEAGYRYGRRLAFTGLGVAAGAWVVMLAFWPWAMYDPLRRPFAALRVMSNYLVIERKMPFAGEQLSSYDVDWTYLVHYFGLQLPEFVVVLCAVGLVASVVLLARRAREPRRFSDNLVLGTMLVALLFPWAYAIHKHSPLYDGLRHFLFLVPILVASAAWTASALIELALERAGRWAAPVCAVLTLGLCADQYATMVRLHPHQYVYFNRFIGGVEGAVGQYSTAYYASTYDEGARELGRVLWQQEPQTFLNTIYDVKGCVRGDLMLHQAPPNFRNTKQDFQFWLGYNRDECHLRYDDSPAIYKVERDGGLLLVVRDRRAVVERAKARREKKRTQTPRGATRARATKDKP